MTMLSYRVKNQTVVPSFPDAYFVLRILGHLLPQNADHEIKNPTTPHHTTQNA
jgi:hypothetical protein